MTASVSFRASRLEIVRWLKDRRAVARRCMVRSASSSVHCVKLHPEIRAAYFGLFPNVSSVFHVLMHFVGYLNVF